MRQTVSHRARRGTITPVPSFPIMTASITANIVPFDNISSFIFVELDGRTNYLVWKYNIDSVPSQQITSVMRMASSLHNPSPLRRAIRMLANPGYVPAQQNYHFVTSYINVTLGKSITHHTPLRCCSFLWHTQRRAFY